jgi:cytochrome c553
MADRYGEVRAPNITLGEGGLSGWQPSDLWSVFRKFRAPEDRPISRQLHSGFQWLSDYDLAAVVSYIRALKPAAGSTERRSISFIDRNTTGFLEASREVRGYVPSLSPQFKKEYGRYIADHVARCGVCHDSASDFFTQKSYWTGGRSIRFGEDEKLAPNISGSQVAGIGAWSEDDIKRFLVSGSTPDGRKIDKNFCPVNFYSQAPEEELIALALYIKSVPASS